ncbi:MAG: 23S rRNA (uracil(1939)-C(5))-methyltransferase RlmD [Candidatus Berkiellales bacterium]
MIDFDITGLSHDGRGIARWQDKIVFVFGALPGETVRAKVTRRHSRFSEATTVEVLKASPQRVTPQCEYFGLCGGCQMQHMGSADQIEHKAKLLKEQLDHHKIFAQTWLPPLTAKGYGYRQKARLGVKYVPQKDALLVGFREQKNNKLAIIESCQVLDPRVGLRIKELRDTIACLEGRNEIAQIELAIGNDEVALVFRHLKPLSESDIAALISFCEKNHFSLFLQPQGVDSVQKVWPENSNNFLSYTLKEQQLEFHFHPCDFTQVNQEMNQKMINQALALLSPNASDTILDLFCGLGNFSLPFAKMAKRVVGVEGTRTMVGRALANAKLNHLTNVDFYTADLEQEFAHHAFAKEDYTKIILDPPRSGALKVVEQIAKFKAKQLLYVSCNPATFVRDAAVLVHQQGFSLQQIGIMDMFPQTAHVETMGLFHLGKKHG